jgi:hypothetical protein
VHYTIESTTGEDPSQYLPLESLQGFLEWDLDEGDYLNLTLPLNWTDVPPFAEYRLSLRLRPVWNAVVDLQAGNETAAHIFGVLPGQCPPGTYRSRGSPPT